MKIVYFTSKTGNTARFVNKLGMESINISKDLIVKEPFILFIPTYASTDGKRSVPTPIKQFLNESVNRSNLRAIVGFGNRNFGRNFAIGAEVVSLKCKVPILHKVELFGTPEDIEIVKNRIKEYE
jgi:protein involved in ribonucleotide reduction